MDKGSIFLLALLSAGSLVANAEAYRWVDSEGVIHYSDRPEPGAEEVSLPEANTTSVRRYANQGTPGNGDEESSTDLKRYESLSIASPAAEETLWNIEGVLNVTLALTPALQPGHQVRVYFDGSPRMVQGTSFQIEDVWRGVHNLQAEVLDETGQLLVRSQPTRFYVQQNTVKR